MTLTDPALLKVVPLLQACDRLESLSLVGNIKLGAALAPFVAAVGRKCKHAPRRPLPHRAGRPASALETLILNHTGIDDAAAPFLAACPELVWLEVAETKMTSDGLFLVLDGCPRLATLGLRSCRGVRVGDRRRFFEAWEEDRAGA
ncbi:hypothetical protein B0H13DRAFT_2432786 [Mycena leptocephala]|nr:hypothetical protein B0H13DRAFT_2432786 [Mycena leptocephala]